MGLQLFTFALMVFLSKAQTFSQGPVNVQRIDPQEVAEYLPQSEVTSNRPFIDPPGFRERFDLNPVAFPQPEFDRNGNKNPIIRADFNPPPGQFPDYFAVDDVNLEPLPQGGPIYKAVPLFQSELPPGEFPLYVPDPLVNEMTGMRNPVFVPYINRETGLSRYLPFRTPDLPPEEWVFPKDLTSRF